MYVESAYDETNMLGHDLWIVFRGSNQSIIVLTEIVGFMNVRKQNLLIPTLISYLSTLNLLKHVLTTNNVIPKIPSFPFC